MGHFVYVGDYKENGGDRLGGTDNVFSETPLDASSSAPALQAALAAAASSRPSRAVQETDLMGTESSGNGKNSTSKHLAPETDVITNGRRRKAARRWVIAVLDVKHMERIMDPIRDLLIARMVQEIDIGTTSADLQRHLNTKPSDNADEAEHAAWLERGQVLSDKKAKAQLPDAFICKGESQAKWIYTADYCDRYFANSVAEMRVYYICKATHGKSRPGAAAFRPTAVGNA